MPNELKRELRVLDMMITAHSCTRDRYLRFDKTVTVIILVFSVVLCTFSFIPRSEVHRLGMSVESSNLVIALTSSGVLILSIIQLFSKWKEVAQDHINCLIDLSRLKGEYRLLQTRGGDSEKMDKISGKFHNLLSVKPVISDKYFIKYKKYHYKKIEISKMISKNPGCPIFIINISVLCTAIKTFFSKN